jgi:type II restriction enzyme
MNLGLPTTGLELYKSESQRARVATEGWAANNLYCPNCDSPSLEASPANTPATDFICPQCAALFQLKGQSRPLSLRITDAAYETMRRAIEQDRTPNLFALHYARDVWRVANLILVPRFAFSTSALEKRKALGRRARRAGWVGCNIVLGNIPPDARIPVVLEGIVSSPEKVRRQYARLRPLSQLKHEQRGWTLDVLKVIRSLDCTEFSLREAYTSEEELAQLHPKNRHIRDKIRQQLQVLRDMGIVEFLGGGNYRLR